MPNKTVHSGTKIALSNANEAENSSRNQQEKHQQTPDQMKNDKKRHEKQQSQQNFQQEMKIEREEERGERERKIPNGTAHMGTKAQYSTLPTKPTAAETSEKNDHNPPRK